jgi:hypothetical protein
MCVLIRYLYLAILAFPQNNSVADPDTKSSDLDLDPGSLMNIILDIKFLRPKVFLKGTI